MYDIASAVAQAAQEELTRRLDAQDPDGNYRVLDAWPEHDEFVSMTSEGLVSVHVSTSQAELAAPEILRNTLATSPGVNTTLYFLGQFNFTLHVNLWSRHKEPLRYRAGHLEAILQDFEFPVPDRFGICAVTYEWESARGSSDDDAATKNRRKIWRLKGYVHLVKQAETPSQAVFALQQSLELPDGTLVTRNSEA